MSKHTDEYRCTKIHVQGLSKLYKFVHDENFTSLLKIQKNGLVIGYISYVIAYET